MSRSDGRPQAQGGSSYSSLAGFYRADERRVRSRELDVGLWWRAHPDGPLHRAAWVRDTGELYLTRLGPSAEGGGAVEVLAVVTDSERLESALAGWRERCGEPGSLAWLRERAAPMGMARRPRPSRPPASVGITARRRTATALGAGLS
jgi:hypothetical protein